MHSICTANHELEARGAAHLDRCMLAARLPFSNHNRNHNIWSYPQQPPQDQSGYQLKPSITATMPETIAAPRSRPQRPSRPKEPPQPRDGDTQCSKSNRSASDLAEHTVVPTNHAPTQYTRVGKQVLTTAQRSIFLCFSSPDLAPTAGDALMSGKFYRTKSGTMLA